jgi:hypothetical protein
VKKSGFLLPPATSTAAKCTRLVVNRRAGGRRSGRSTPHRVLLRAVCMRRDEVAMVDCNSSVMEIDLQLEEGGGNGHAPAPAPAPASAVLRPPRAADPEMINEYIGFGMLQENGSLYRERFVVRFSEVGPRRTTSLETLTCLLQVRVRCMNGGVSRTSAMVKKLCLMCVLVHRMHCTCSADKQWNTYIAM